MDQALDIAEEEEEEGEGGPFDGAKADYQTSESAKPPFSYATMISQAIAATADKKITLANIYSFIAER